MPASNLAPAVFPATFWDLVPFVCAGALALVFTALLVLLVEDAEDDQLSLKSAHQHVAYSASSHSKSKHSGSSKPLFGLSEREKVNWFATPKHGHPSVGLTDEMAAFVKQYQHQMGYRAPMGINGLPKRLLVTPTKVASPSPTPAGVVTPPKLSMAKLIMHRHDQATRRARQARQQQQQQRLQAQQLSTAILPPSPPPPGVRVH